MDFPPISSVKSAFLEALNLAAVARGKTSPNPMVGAVILDETGEVIGRGYHHKAGEPHAEVLAIQDAKTRTADLSSSILIVTLEPCGHFGRTPPCVDLILTEKIQKVVVGCLDPNPLMKGKSLESLKQNGVKVELAASLLGAEFEKQSEKLIRGFRSVLESSRPYVTLKCAVSLDGKIATAGGESQWITDEPARQMGHKERSEHDAILVGVGTVLADDPRLNVRWNGTGRPITKVILDSQLRTPANARLFESGDKVLIYCEWNYPKDKKEKLESAGAVVVVLGDGTRPFTLDAVHIQEVLKNLAQRGVQEVLVEGGARVLGAFVRERAFDRMIYFIAPKILGSASRDVFEGYGPDRLSDSVRLENLSARNVGPDILIEGTKSCSPV